MQESKSVAAGQGSPLAGISRIIQKSNIGKIIFSFSPSNHFFRPSVNRAVSGFRILHTRLYLIYTKSILKLYSNHTESILNIYSIYTRLPFSCRSSVSHLTLTRYSVYIRSILFQSGFILVQYINPLALHLGRPPPVYVYKKTPDGNQGLKFVFIPEGMSFKNLK